MEVIFDMKLDILIPHYKETDAEIKPLLDSIAIQQNVDFKNIRAIIVNDGDEVLLSDELIHGYPYPILYQVNPHRGVSATRNACLDLSDADYVMFCDADDMFYNACGLWIVFREMEIGFDTLVSAFTEESYMQDTKEIVYINHDVDSTFVHGKIHRRQFLIDNNIRWNDALTIHEDSYFNCLCQRLAKPEEAKYCQTPFYLWKWRDNSVCRHDPLYLNKTMVNMLESNSALVRQFLQRKRVDDARFYATSMIYDVYYSLNCDRWWSEEGHEYLHMTELRFQKYWKEVKPLFDTIGEDIKRQIIMGIKNRFFNEGLFMERITFSDWIEHIEKLK